MVPFRVLSRSNLAHRSHQWSLNPRPVKLLQPLVPLQKSQLLWNQTNPASFCKTSGVEVPLRQLVRCTEAQKCLFVSPFLVLATLTHSVSRKSFPCNSYANTRDGVGVSPSLHFSPSLPLRLSFRPQASSLQPPELLP